MKKVLRFVSIMLLCCALCSPVVEARGPETTQQSNNSRRGDNNSRRKNNHSQSNNNHSQSNNKPAPGHRPSDRPGNQHKPSQRPGHNFRPEHRPEHRPNRPEPKPPHHNAGHHHHHYYRPAPPPRPYLPPARAYYRPLPPPSWHAPAHWSPIRTILGVALGTTINASINLLVNAGYTVNSYVNDAIYLNNVPMLGMYWSDATMYYNHGILAGSEFVYYTPGPDRYRFNTAYDMLVHSYGMPASQSLAGNTLSASWWGAGNQFITLTYSRQYSVNGGLNYYTTLTFGN